MSLKNNSLFLQLVHFSFSSNHDMQFFISMHFTNRGQHLTVPREKAGSSSLRSKALFVLKGNLQDKIQDKQLSALNGWMEKNSKENILGSGRHLEQLSIQKVSNWLPY